jgi:hypothetical protein
MLFRIANLWHNMRRKHMPWNRNRGAWVWVTIAAIALVSAGRADGARPAAKTGAHAALAFLARSQSLPLIAKSGMSAFAPRTSGRRIVALLRGTGIGAWMAILPFLFVAVISPLRALLAVSLPRSGRTPIAPLLPAAFQRPPPRLA